MSRKIIQWTTIIREFSTLKVISISVFYDYYRWIEFHVVSLIPVNIFWAKPRFKNHFAILVGFLGFHWNHFGFRTGFWAKNVKKWFLLKPKILCFLSFLGLEIFPKKNLQNRLKQPCGKDVKPPWNQFGLKKDRFPKSALFS